MARNSPPRSKVEQRARRRKPARREARSEPPGDELLTDQTSPSRPNHPIGMLMRRYRKERRISLTELSKLTGITVPTLSRLENGKIGASFDRISKIAEGLRIPLPQLFNADAASSVAASVDRQSGGGRRSISRAAERSRTQTSQYQYETLCWEFRDQALFPAIVKLQCRDLKDYGPLVRHEGQELLYVLRGRCRVVTEQYEDTLLDEGDAIYIDSAMGHALLNALPQGETWVLGCMTVKRSLD